MKGPVAVVDAVFALQLRCGGQQHNTPLHVVHKVVAPPVEKTHGPQHFQYQLLDLFRGLVWRLALVNGLCNVQGRIDLPHRVVAQLLLGSGAHIVQVAQGRMHFFPEADFLLLHHHLLEALHRIALLRQVLPREKHGQRQGNEQHQHQCADEVQPGQGGFVGSDAHQSGRWPVKSPDTGCRHRAGEFILVACLALRWAQTLDH